MELNQEAVQTEDFCNYFLFIPWYPQSLMSQDVVPGAVPVGVTFKAQHSERRRCCRSAPNGREVAAPPALSVPGPRGGTGTNGEKPGKMETAWCERTSTLLAWKNLLLELCCAACSVLADTESHCVICGLYAWSFSDWATVCLCEPKYSVPLAGSGSW